MDFLESNLVAIRAHKPRLFLALKDYLSSAAPGLEFRLLDFGDGYSNLVTKCASGETSSLYPSHPSETALKSFEMSSLDSPKLVIVNGFGLGYHFMDFLRTKPKSVRDILVIEKSPWHFVQALRVQDLSQVIESNDVEFLVGLFPSQFHDAAAGWLTRHERVIFASRIGNLHFEPALRSEGAYYLAFKEALHAAVDRVRDAFVAPGEDGYRALMNIVRNRSFIETAPAFEFLEGCLAGVPAFLVGSGPSLESEWEQLARYRDRAVILSADAAVKPLLKRGIIPHLVITTERVAVTSHFLSGLPADFQAPLLALPSSYPETLAAYPGPVVLLSRAATFGAWLAPQNPDAELALGVTPAGYQLLSRLGCSEIALIGQDLSWPEGHADGYADGTAVAAVGSAKDAMSTGPCTVLGNSGKDVSTTLGWKNSLRELEFLIPTLGVSCRQVIGNGAGAKILGALRVDPASFWSSISSRPDILDVETRLSDALKKTLPSAPAKDLMQLFRRTAQDLETFIHGMHGMLNEMSSDYHERVNVSDAASFLPKFEATLDRWRALETDLIGRHAELFYFFINVMSGGAYVSHLSAREATAPDFERPVFFMFHYLVKTVEWGNDAAAWAGRALHLLRQVEG